MMTWRNRNLFRKKAVPVQKFNMGGSVKGVEALKNVAPTMGTFDYDNAVNMMGGGMVDMPVPQMQMGGSPQIEMFESGDSALNEALNAQAAVDTMNQSLMTGGGDAVPQSMMAAPMAEEAPMMEDQGPELSNAALEFSNQALKEAKESSQDIIAQAMGEIEKEIDAMEEVSIDEMKELAELITMQQRRLDSASTELTKAMGLGEELEATLFDNEFEREMQKKYPLVTAALEKTLPNIMDTEQIADATMPSDDTPVMAMQKGGDPLTEAIENYNKAKENYDRLKFNEGRGRDAPSPEAIETARLAMEQALQVVSSLQGGGPSETTGAPSSVKIPSTAEEAVTQNLYGSLFDTNKRTYEDVLKQPGVQKIYSDLEKMIDQAGIGNVKDTKATGTQAATGVMRDVAAGEAGARLKKAQLELGLVGDIEGDPYGTKGRALTTEQLNVITKGDTRADAAWLASGESPFLWMSKGMSVPSTIRNLTGLKNSLQTKDFGGKKLTFLQMFNDTLNSDPRVLKEITTYTDPSEARAKQDRFVALIVDAWNSGIYNPADILIKFGIKPSE